MPDKIYKLNKPEVQDPITHNKIAALKIEIDRPYLVHNETGGPDPVAGEIQVWLSRTRSNDGANKSEPKTNGVYVVLSGPGYEAVRAQIEALENALYSVLSSNGYIDPGVVENA